MNKKLLLLLPALALLGQGCDMSTGTQLPGPMTPPASTSTASGDGAMCHIDTPQVYYVTKTLFSAAELRQIERDVVAPIKAHYDDETYGHAASIMLKKDGTDLIVEIIIDQTWTTDAGYEGVLLPRLKDGSYEAWTPTDPGPGYEG